MSYEDNFVLYGFCSPSGEMLYVGCTCNLQQRAIAHRSKRPYFKECTLVRFREFFSGYGKALRIEAQIIEAYKRRGQCCLNSEWSHLGILRECYGPKPSYSRHNATLRKKDAVRAKYGEPSLMEEFLAKQGQPSE